MSQDTPDVVNAFGVLAKEDTSHGFPTRRPMERNSDWAIYNVNSEGWFQCWSLIASVAMVAFWFYMAGWHFFEGSQGVDDEDGLRHKDSKSTNMWERTFWSFTYQIHG